MILIDAHAHIYDCFHLQTFFDSALANFKAEASRRRRKGFFTAVLLLTETADDNWFQRLANYALNERRIKSNDCGHWSFKSTKETCSLLARCDGGEGFFVISGCQILTAEGLEVLALITDSRFQNGLPLEEVIQIVRKDGAIPVIPWGFGKWIGRRGRILKNELEKAEQSELFLGDNGGRPLFLPLPSHFSLAKSKGIRVLPGSDPLPLASESGRSGRFGFSVAGSITPDHPGSDLKCLLLDQNTSFRAYGKLEHPFRFCRNQFRLRIMRG
jgi:hypothetical protein